MSLTDILSKSQVGKAAEVKKVISSISPTNSMFETISGSFPFSEASYKQLVPYKLKEVRNSSLLGTAFDYGARALISRYVEDDGKAIKGTVAESAVLILVNKISNRNEKQNLIDSFKYYRSCLESYVLGYEYRDDYMIDACIYFSILESSLRSHSDNVNINKIDIIDAEVKEELKSLLHLFRLRMPNVVRYDSKVIYNPKFGRASMAVGGADADIWIDGTLWDFKTTKSCSFNSLDAKQLIGYYLLHRVDEESGRLGEIARSYQDIQKIGFYKARFGEFEVLDLSKYSKEKLDNAYCELLQLLM